MTPDLYSLFDNSDVFRLAKKKLGLLDGMAFWEIFLDKELFDKVIKEMQNLRALAIEHKKSFKELEEFLGL